MRPLAVVALVAGISLVAGAAAAVWKASLTDSDTANSGGASTLVSQVAAPAIDFRDLLDPGPKLRPSAKAISLNGQRVRVVGFMAKMEEPIRGGFYLVPRPLSLDESGAGTGDLPLESVLVLMPGSENKTIPHLTGALEGVGILEVGNRSDSEGRVSNFRLQLDADQRLVQPRVTAVLAASK